MEDTMKAYQVFNPKNQVLVKGKYVDAEGYVKSVVKLKFALDENETIETDAKPERLLNGLIAHAAKAEFQLFEGPQLRKISAPFEQEGRTFYIATFMAAQPSTEF